VENYWGNDYTLLPNRECNQKQKHKKQPWSNVECFAFGGETSFHAANHTIPPQVRSTGIAKRLFFMFFVSVPPCIYPLNRNKP